MGKYIFQTGGGNSVQQNPLVVESDSGQSFNSYVDSLIQQQQLQQQQIQQPQQQEAQPEEEESEYIKNLREYYKQQDEDTKQSSYDNRLKSIEDHIHNTANNLDEQQTAVNWMSSDDGLDYTRSFYDKDNQTPVFSAPKIPEHVSNEIRNHYDNRSSLTSSGLQERQLLAESGGNDNAVSPAGAVGPYQFMPSTWEEYKPRPNANPRNREDSGKAYQNFMGVLLKQFNGDQRKAVAAYNWGPGKVERAIKNKGVNWEEELPNETKTYLKNVFDNDIQTAHSADISNIKPKLLNIVGTLSKQFSGLKVTSGTEGQHTNNSAHYDGEAVDIGANSSNKKAYREFVEKLPELKEKYGINYIDEGDHIHLSLSSKGKI